MNTDLRKRLGELEEAFHANPTDVVVLAELANLELTIGDNRKALRWYRALLLQKLEPAGPISKAEVFLRLGHVHLRMGQRDEAIGMLERALEADPKLPRAAQLLSEARSPPVEFTAGEREALGRMQHQPGVLVFLCLFAAFVLLGLGAKCRSHGAEARNQAETLACGKAGCAAFYTFVGGGCRKGSGYQFVYRKETPEGSTLWFASFECPRKYWIFGDHECRRDNGSDSPYTGPVP